MPERTVAIVGRPNVGKSALFNRLAGRTISIVHDQPGVTRDRIVSVCRRGEAPFTIVDTGGIGANADVDFSERIHAEADLAVAASDLILLVVDALEGLHPVDAELAKRLRRSKRPVLVAANKIDTAKQDNLAAEFARLGFADPAPVSAAHGRGMESLVERIESLLPPPAAEETEGERPVLLAVVGRPNVGKSSLVNAILQDRRTIVSEVAGTTRDAVDVEYRHDGRPYTLIDTAGIRHRSRHSTSVEVFSVMRAERSIRRADLCLLVLDASAGVTAQDKRIAGLIAEAEKPCAVILNKWDLVKPDKGSREKLVAEVAGDVRRTLFFLDYAPVVVLSAQTGEHLSRVFRAVEKIRQASEHRLGTGPLNRLFQLAQQRQPPPLKGSRRFKILYVTQPAPDKPRAINPPALLGFVNDRELCPDEYLRYLERAVRAEAPWTGLPIRWFWREREKRARGRE